MKKVLLSAGLCTLALAGWTLWSAPSNAAQGGDVKATVLKIADALKKGDAASADKDAAALAKSKDLDEVMDLFKKRDKGGIGVGSKKDVAVPDGIEVKLVALGRDAPSAGALKKEGEALEEMGYVIAAVAKVAKLKPAPKSKSAEWNSWCDDMAANAVKLSAAAKGQVAADVKTLAKKINDSCNACHSKYRV